MVSILLVYPGLFPHFKLYLVFEKAKGLDYKGRLYNSASVFISLDMLCILCF